MKENHRTDKCRLCLEGRVYIGNGEHITTIEKDYETGAAKLKYVNQCLANIPNDEEIDKTKITNDNQRQDTFAYEMYENLECSKRNFYFQEELSRLAILTKRALYFAGQVSYSLFR